MENLNYGIVGNCKSAALISDRGSVEWLCLPQFDSASVFAKILDENIGGSFEILTDEDYEIQQEYIQNTNILKTTFTNGNHCFEVRDFMPRYIKKDQSYFNPPSLIRYLVYVSGKPKFRVQYNPKLEYAQGTTNTLIQNEFIVSYTSHEKFDSLFLYTDFNKEKVIDGEEIELVKNGFFLLSYREKLFLPTIQAIYLEYERTKVYWLEWLEKLPKYDAYNQEITRSALTLKLLTYDKTGAILAAATTSLPETIGEVRNWDYRFCWIRDASMAVKVLAELNNYKTARRYLQFIVDLLPEKDEKLQIMYGINKEKKLTEYELSHLSGYRNSKPVRVGNAAYQQQQNDIYGILMDVIHQQLVKFSVDIENGEELWNITKGVIWVVNQHWKEKDKGIWEFRQEDRHFTFSKVLCWVAVDRAIKVAEIIGKKSVIEAWAKLRDEIKYDVMQNAWDEEKQAFTQSYASADLDASVLLMADYGFIDAKSPKYISTVHAIEKELSFEGLLYRYKNQDDFGLPSSSFTICTFWFINSLYKIGEGRKAKRLFDRLLTYSNHLGLFSEDVDFKTKRLLGNFPQAYSHLALIETAINLSKITPEEEVLHTMEQKEEN